MYFFKVPPHLKYNFRHNLKPYCISLGVTLAWWNDASSVVRQIRAQILNLPFTAQSDSLSIKCKQKNPKSSLPKLVTIGDNTYKEPGTSNKT